MAAACSAQMPPIPVPTEPCTWWAPSKCGRARGRRWRPPGRSATSTIVSRSSFIIRVEAMLKRFIFAVLLATPVTAQRESEYDASVVKQVRIDLRDLGYPPLDVIPSDESAIRALAVAPDGTLYGATCGTRSHLFMLSPVHGYVLPLGVLEGV